MHGEPQATLYLMGKLLQNFTLADRFVDRWSVYTALGSSPSCFGTQAQKREERLGEENPHWFCWSVGMV